MGYVTLDDLEHAAALLKCSPSLLLHALLRSSDETQQVNT